MRLATILILLINVTFAFGRCIDFPRDWKDKDGQNCAQYAKKATWCQSADSYANNDGDSASDVCCACGGGRRTQGNTCTDNMAWRDKSNLGCKEYNKYPSWCDHAWKFAFRGRDARTECCVCMKNAEFMEE